MRLRTKFQATNPKPKTFFLSQRPQRSQRKKGFRKRERGIVIGYSLYGKKYRNEDRGTRIEDRGTRSQDSGLNE
jgi:hypothetical protein